MPDPNYPDDIRQYDDDPRSPFYDEDKHRGEEPDEPNEPEDCEFDRCDKCNIKVLADYLLVNVKGELVCDECWTP